MRCLVCIDCVREDHGMLAIDLAIRGRMNEGCSAIMLNTLHDAGRIVLRRPEPLTLGFHIRLLLSRTWGIALDRELPTLSACFILRNAIDSFVVKLLARYHGLLDELVDA